MPSFSRTAVIALILTLTGCLASTPEKAPGPRVDMDLYLPGDFRQASENNFFERSGYRINFEKFAAGKDNTETHELPLPGGSRPADLAGVLGREIDITEDLVRVPASHAVHRFSAVKGKQTALEGLCIGDLDLNPVNKETRARLLGADQAGKTYGKNLFTCFLIGSSGKQFQLIMVNDFAIGAFTRGLLTDGHRWYQVNNLRNLVNSSGTTLYKGYNMVGYQVESDSEILSALRIFNSYKVWLKKEMDLDLKQALSATMAVLNHSYNSDYRGAVVSHSTPMATK